jgi:hypothetical protein
MPHMTAELSDGTEIDGVHEVVEGSNGVHLKREVDGEIRRAAYIPYPQLTYVYRRSRPSASGLDPEAVHRNR